MQLTHSISDDRRGSDRLHPRRRCHLRLERVGYETAAVKDIGLGGLRMLASGLLPGDVQEGLLHIPGSSCPCDVRFEVVHVDDRGAAGARFDSISAGTRLRLTEYVEHVRSVELLKRLQARLGVRDLANLKPMGDPDATARLIERLADDRAALRVWSDPRQPSFEAHLLRASDGHLTLSMTSGSGLAPFDEVVFAVDEGELVYMADTTVAAAGDHGAVIVMPERMYRPERRRDLRDDASGAVVGELRAYVAGQTWRLPVLEESGSGLSVVAPRRLAIQANAGDRWDGQVVRQTGGTAELQAQVAYVGSLGASPAHGEGFRVGLQRLIDRMEVPVTPADFSGTQAPVPQRGLRRQVRRARDAARGRPAGQPPRGYRGRVGAAIDRRPWDRRCAARRDPACLRAQEGGHLWSGADHRRDLPAGGIRRDGRSI